MIYLFSLYQTSVQKKIYFVNGIISPVRNMHQTKLHSGFSDHRVVHLAGTIQVTHCANLSTDALCSAGIRHLNYLKNELYNGFPFQEEGSR